MHQILVLNLQDIRPAGLRIFLKPDNGYPGRIPGLVGYRYRKSCFLCKTDFEEVFPRIRHKKVIQKFLYLYNEQVCSVNYKHSQQSLTGKQYSKILNPTKKAYINGELLGFLVKKFVCLLIQVKYLSTIDIRLFRVVRRKKESNYLVTLCL